MTKKVGFRARVGNLIYCGDRLHESYGRGTHNEQVQTRIQYRGEGGTRTAEEGRIYIDLDKVVKIYIGSTNCTEPRWYFSNDRKNMKIEKFLHYNKKLEKSRK